MRPSGNSPLLPHVLPLYAFQLQQQINLQDNPQRPTAPILNDSQHSEYSAEGCSCFLIHHKHKKGKEDRAPFPSEPSEPFRTYCKQSFPLLLVCAGKATLKEGRSPLPAVAGNLPPVPLLVFPFARYPSSSNRSKADRLPLCSPLLILFPPAPFSVIICKRYTAQKAKHAQTLETQRLERVFEVCFLSQRWNAPSQRWNALFVCASGLHCHKYGRPRHKDRRFLRLFCFGS